MDFPIEVQDITYDQDSPYWKASGVLTRAKCGDMVAVRPCAEEHEGKTFLGIYLGEVPLSLGVRYDPEEKELLVTRGRYNPAIFVPELDDIVLGAESWWGQIESEDQLREITDDDIENVWYVRALNGLDKAV